MTQKQQGVTTNLVTRIQEETPGIAQRIHLDNAGSSLMAAPVIAVLQSAFDREVRFGGYVAQAQQQDAFEGSYRSLAKLLDASIKDVAFVGNAVDGWTKAFYSLPFVAGDNIVTAYNEYCSNYIAYIQMANTRGIEIRIARSLPEGGIDLDHLQTLIDSRTCLISISHMPSSSGEINQAAHVGKIAKNAGVLYQLDACQSTGHVPVSVQEIGCDIMTGTARKFLRGPRGVGFLYVNERARAEMEPVILTNQAAEWVTADSYKLRDDARIFEAWERSIVNQLGFAAAIDYLLDISVDNACSLIKKNADYLREQLSTITGVTMTCPPAAQSAIITFNVDGFQPQDVKDYMEQRDIAVQVASQSHTRLDLEARNISSTIRISPHYYTPQNHLDDFLNALTEMQNGV